MAIKSGRIRATGSVTTGARIALQGCQPYGIVRPSMPSPTHSYMMEIDVIGITSSLIENSNVIATILGIGLGIGFAVFGWQALSNISGIVSLLSTSGISTLLQIFKSSSSEKPFNYFVFGLILSTFSVLVLSAAWFYRALKQDYRDAGVKHYRSQALFESFSLFSIGIKGFIYNRSNQPSEALIAGYLSGLYRSILDALKRGETGRERFIELMRLQATLLLMSFYEQGKGIDRYRLAFYEVSRDGKNLDFMFGVSRGADAEHSRKPLPVADTVLGQALREDRILIYPKTPGLKVEKRENRIWCSFLAIPVPLKKGPKGAIGGVTIDYIGESNDFDSVIKTTIATQYCEALAEAYSSFQLNQHGGKPCQSQNP